MGDSSATETKPSRHDERREYFRIEDDIRLRFTPCSLDDVERGVVPAELAPNDCDLLMQELRHLEHENSHVLRAIGEESWQLELYLKNINKRLELISGHLRANASKQQGPCRRITLSEAGLDFSHEQTIEPNSYLAIEIVMQPSFIALVLFAQVMSCSEVAPGFKIGLRFINITNDDRQLLAKHIMQLQIASKKSQREN